MPRYFVSWKGHVVRIDAHPENRGPWINYFELGMRVAQYFNRKDAP